jgi:pantothenate synthetase
MQNTIPTEDTQRMAHQGHHILIRKPHSESNSGRIVPWIIHMARFGQNYKKYPTTTKEQSRSYADHEIQSQIVWSHFVKGKWTIKWGTLINN